MGMHQDDRYGCRLNIARYANWWVLLQDRRLALVDYIFATQSAIKISMNPYKCRQTYKGVEAIKMQSLEKNFELWVCRIHCICSSG